MARAANACPWPHERRPCGSSPEAFPSWARTAISTTRRWCSTPTATWWPVTARRTSTRPPRSLPSSAPGDRLTTFEDPTLGVVGVVICFDGDFPEVARTLASRGARLVVAPSAYEVEGATTWDLLYPALALANSQWWVQSNQCGAHATTTLLGASRIVAPTGTVVAEATRTVPGCTYPPELLVQRIDLQLAYQRDGIGTLLEEGRRPHLYLQPGGEGPVAPGPPAAT